MGIWPWEFGKWDLEKWELAICFFGEMGINREFGEFETWCIAGRP
jgi:hypothetical protein